MEDKMKTGKHKEADEEQSPQREQDQGSKNTRHILRKSNSGLIYSAPPDGGYGWLILAASFFLQMASLGTSYTVGIFSVELQETFDAETSKTALVGSLCVGVLYVTGPFTTPLTQRFGFRTVVMCGGFLAATGYMIGAFATNINSVIFTSGILVGIGYGLVFVPGFVIVGHYFTTRQHIAMPISFTGIASGSLAMAPFIRALINVYGWRGTYMVLAGISLNMCVAGALLIPVEIVENKSEHLENKKLFDTYLLRDPKMWTLIVCTFLWNLGSLVLILLIPDYALEKGIHVNDVPLIHSVKGCCSIFGRIVTAFLPHTARFDRTVCLSFSTALAGLAVVMVTVNPSLCTLLAWSAVYGFSLGVQVSCEPVLLTRMYGVGRLNSSYGLLMLGYFAGSVVGPPIGGWLYERTQDFNIPFITAGSLSFLAALVYLIIFFCLKKHDQIIMNSEKEEKSVKDLSISVIMQTEISIHNARI